MNVPGLGEVTKEGELNWYYSEEIAVPVLDGMKCQIVLEGYDDDANPDDFHEAIKNFLAIDPAVLRQVEPYLYLYYEDCMRDSDAEDREFLDIKSADEVWNHVQFGSEPAFSRRSYGDNGIYVSLECGCDWEQEHGLQIVFKNGLEVNKVGPYDGHVTNSDAFADESLEDVIYR